MHKLTTTEYLFGKKKEEYGPELERIAKLRLEDARTLGIELFNKLSYDPKKQGPEQLQIQRRLNKVQDAIATWKKILELEEY